MREEIKAHPIGKEMNKAEEAFLEAFPPMMMDNFRKIMGMLTATGLINLNDAIKNGSPVPFDPSVVVAAMYMGMLQCLSLDGMMPIKETKVLVDETLKKIIEKSVVVKDGAEFEAFKKSLETGEQLADEDPLDNIIPINTTKH